MPGGCQHPVTIIPVALIDQGVASLCLAGITGSADSSERRVERLRGAEAGSRGSCAPVAQHTRMVWGKGAWMSGCRLDGHCLLASHTGPASCAAWLRRSAGMSGWGWGPPGSNMTSREN